MKKKKIKIDDQEIVVKKLAIGRYYELIESFKDSDFLVKVGTMDMQGEKFMAQLPLLISQFAQEFIKFVSMTTDMTEKEINENLAPADLVDVLKAVFEVNDFDKIKKNLELMFGKLDMGILTQLANTSKKPENQETDGSLTSSTSSPQATDGQKAKS